MRTPLKIRWANNTNFKTSPKAAFEEIERIRQVYSYPRVADFVTEFSKRKSPLHNELQWDNSIAADLYREDQARRILRSLIVCYEAAPNIETRAYRAVLSGEINPETHRPIRCYTSTSEALADPVMREQILARAMAALARWRVEYAELSELTTIFAAIDQTAVNL